MKGKNFIRIGLLCLCIALLLSLYNGYCALRAGKSSNDALGKLEFDQDTLLEGETEDYIINPDMEMPIQTIDGLDYVGMIQIPALDLNLPVLSECTMANLDKAPCRYLGTCYKENFIIGAHNSYYHFGNLKKLKQGDVIAFVDMKERMFQYKVVGTEILMPNQGLELEQGNYDLTLFTCTWAGYSRVVVRCEKI